MLTWEDHTSAFHYLTLLCTISVEILKKAYENSEFKIMDSIWDEKFGLPDETYSVSDNNICFQCILKKYTLVEKKKIPNPDLFR